MSGSVSVLAPLGVDGWSYYLGVIQRLSMDGADFIRYERGIAEPRHRDWHVVPKYSWERLSDQLMSSPNWNVGVRLGGWSKLGRRYLACIDFDVRDPAKATEAHAWMMEHCPEYLNLPSIIRGTGSASRHFYGTFLGCPTRINLAKGHGWSIDVCGSAGKGCQNLWAGSRHPVDGLYTFEREFEIERIWDALQEEREYDCDVPCGLEFSTKFEMMVYEKIRSDEPSQATPDDDDLIG